VADIHENAKSNSTFKIISRQKSLLKTEVICVLTSEIEKLPPVGTRVLHELPKCRLSICVYRERHYEGD